MRRLAKLLGLAACLIFSSAKAGDDTFLGEHLSLSDAVYVVNQAGDEVFSWQADKPMIPASLTKLATAYLALQKWGAGYRFRSDFLLHNNTLWVKGFGDPFLISEELDLVVQQLQVRLSELGLTQIDRISVDNHYFSLRRAPGRTRVSDPYNAPLSAVAANFNTAMLQTKAGRLISAEPQTPLTSTARQVATGIGRKATRVNLINAENAQRNFAELLIAKGGWATAEVSINQRVPKDATHLLTHRNSRTLDQVLRGTLEFSNNFIANQVFLKLSEQPGMTQLNFSLASNYAQNVLAENFHWQSFAMFDGAGLTRDNRLSARQIDDLLQGLTPHKQLLKAYLVGRDDVEVRAKTGTLSDVQSFAGFIDFPTQRFRFVFNFNRPVPYRYRDKLLIKLVADLKQGLAGEAEPES